MDSAIGIYIRTFNWEMKQARKALGLSQLALVDMTGIPINRIQELEQLRRLPTREETIDLAAVLQVEPDRLFPRSLLERVKANLGGATSFEFKMPVEVLSLSDVPIGLLPSGDIEDDPGGRVGDLPDRLADVLLSLTRRERAVIERRFGLGDGVEETREEVAGSVGVTGARISQIEAKALRKLRHPSRSKRLRGFLFDDTAVFAQDRCQKCGGQMVRQDGVPACFACGWKIG